MSIVKCFNQGLTSRLSLSVALLALAGCATSEIDSPTANDADTEPAYPDPTRFEDDIARFEARDAENPPPENAVLFVGSSSFAMWNADLPQDMAPLTVVPRGFGGSNMNDLMHYADRVVFPYEPKAIVVYEGDNDIANGISPRGVFQSFRAFEDQARKQLGEVDIYFVSIKPSIARWSLWPKMAAANRLIEEYCEGSENLFYLDIATPMLGDDGQPDPAHFVDDNLHMTRAGYEIWKDVIRRPLVERYQR